MKKHLNLSAQARKTLKNGSTSIASFLKLPDPESKKEAHAFSALALALARNNQEKISKETVIHQLNQLKGKQGKSKKTISHVLEDAANSIPGSNPVSKKIKSELEFRSNQHMTSVVAETVLDALIPNGGRNKSVTEYENGWKQLFIAIGVVLGFKFFLKK